MHVSLHIEATCKPILHWLPPNISLAFHLFGHFAHSCMDVFRQILVQQLYQGMVALDYPQENVNGLILSGFVVPVFFVSLFYYRIKRNRIEKEQETNKKEKHD